MATTTSETNRMDECVNASFVYELSLKNYIQLLLSHYLPRSTETL